MKQWKVLNKGPHFARASRGKQKLSNEEIVKVLLSNRGITSKKEIEGFLNPDLASVTIKSCGIDSDEVLKALKRIQKAIKKNETIVIFGDYDVDGICGTAILWETLFQYTKTVHPYIPDRFDAGYGLSIKGIDAVLEKFPATSLIITVDNGIVAYEPTAYATSKNIDVITTDHHVPGDKTLDNFATVHTTKLCGTGVAYLLAKEFSIFNSQFSSELQSSNIQKNEEPNTHLDLVALATVADLVPLTHANRTLVMFGLDALRHTNRPGLLALYSIAGIDAQKIGTYEIGHVIAPRLNAAGRLFSAMDGLRLICTKSSSKAQELASNLEATNRERQAITQDSTSHAKLAALTNTNSRIVLVHHASYNEGIIGLIASRLVEEYYRPSFVIARGQTMSKGSARSISGVNIIEMIRSVGPTIVQAGGHPMAAGFTLETSRIEEFTNALEAVAEKLVLDEHLVRSLTIDMPLDFCDISPEFYQNLQLLAPFGMKNSEPTFVTINATIEEIKPLGRDGKHLKFELSQNSKSGGSGVHSCVAFGIGERAVEFKTGDRVEVVYTINENTWNGRTNLQLKIKDIRASN